jgi:Tetratricopeptide repeat
VQELVGRAVQEPLAQAGMPVAAHDDEVGLEHPLTQRSASHYARLLLDTGRSAKALPLAPSALATHETVSGPTHPRTMDSARVTADALDALGRADEAAALRARYGLPNDSQ